MKEDIKTLELAKVYESQGYFEDALKIYSFLDSRESPNGDRSDKAKSDEVLFEIKEGLERTQKKLGKKLETEAHSFDHKDNISKLLEKWLMLMFLKKRHGVFKKIKSWFL